MQAPDDNELEILDRGTCLGLLSTVTLGRVALSVDALPSILPVNFLVVDDEIVIRTGSGAKLRAATDGAVVAFEADCYDEATGLGWSVMVTGIAHVEPTNRFGSAIDTLHAHGNPNATKLISITTPSITGRRLDGTA